MSTILKTATLSVLSFSISGRAQDQEERINAHFPADRRKLPAKGQVARLSLPSLQPFLGGQKEEDRVATLNLSSRSGRTGKQFELGQKTWSAEDRGEQRSPVHHCFSSMPRDRFMVEARHCRRFGRRALGQIPRRPGQSVPDRSESGRFRHLGYGRSTPRKVCRRRTGLRRRKTEWAKKFGSLPIWNFHGDADKVVPVRLSRIMVEAVEKAGGRIKYTEYPESGTIHGLKPTETPNCTIGYSPTREQKVRSLPKGFPTPRQAPYT